MRNATNDNDDPWTSIGLTAALILNKLRLASQLQVESEHENKERKQERPAKGDQSDRKENDSAEYVEARLKRLKEWERQISGNRAVRKK